MQHAVGAPLPPPHQSGNAAAGWPRQAHHPGPLRSRCRPRARRPRRRTRTATP
ncbi:Pro-rich N-terminal domain-containing protein, partial [Streptomyces fradiae]|uniref:Pro-rich N-terminal domain-containing protein n=1 Tax=Streptomyces fradiae TaxID=1906 RepID=UPI0027E3EB9D